MFSRRHFLKLGAAAGLAVAVGYALSGDDSGPGGPKELSDDERARLRFLENLVDDDLDKREDLRQTTYKRPTWLLFSLSFSAYAMTNAAYLDPGQRESSVKHVDLAITKIMEKIQQLSKASVLSTLQAQDLSYVQAVYLSHLNLMMGGYRLISNDDKYDDLHHRITGILAHTIIDSPYKNFDKKVGYNGPIWPADNSVAAASIAIHDRAFDTDSGASRDWLEWIRNNFIDEETGLMNAKLDPATGGAVEGPRGCSLGWTIMFTSLFNNDFARNQYNRFNQGMATDFPFITAFREWRTGHEKREDFQSGPVYFGYGTSATGFGMGAATAVGDYKTAYRINRLIRLFSSTVTNDEGRHYTIYSPLSDALLLACRTMTQW